MSDLAPTTFTSSTIPASWAFSSGRITPLMPLSRAHIAMGKAPLTGRSVPSNANSPNIISLSKYSFWTFPIAARMPMAMGKSNADPSLRISAGAKLIVTCFRGNLNPEFLMAAVTRSLLSFTAPSGSPTVINRGSFAPERLASTSTT